MKFSSIVMVALVSLMLGLGSTPAEAKRMGGGTSFGKSYDYSRTAKPNQKQVQPGSPASTPAAAGTAGQAASGRGGMLGPLAGLAAGGLLAAMFFGGAFEGIQPLDLLLMAGLAFLIFSFMRKRAATGTATATAGAGSGGQWPPQQASENVMHREPVASSTGFNLPEIGSGLKGESLAVNPVWFSEAEFMAEADNHFRALQAHWDRNDMAAIAEYTTPKMYANLQSERGALLSDPHTDVLELNSQLLDLIQDGDKLVAAILFSGLINEDRAPTATRFAEIWHVEHPAADAKGDWLLAGIVQHH